MSLAASRLDIPSLRRFSESFLGRYRSSFHGEGIEFADLRVYEPGDDAGSIDWRATARTGHTLIRRYEEERGRKTIFAIDIGGDMRFTSGTRTKAQTRDEALRLLLAASFGARDRVGSMFFADAVVDTISAQAGIPHMARTLHILDRMNTSPVRPRSSIAPVLDLLVRLRTHDSLIFVITDSMDSIDPVRLRGLAGANALIWLHIGDTAEDDLSRLSHAHIQGTREVGWYDPADDECLAHYRDLRTKAWEHHRHCIEKSGGYISRLDETMDVYMALARFFAKLHHR